MSEEMSMALAEFWHVGSVLFVLIAVISVITGFVREYIPQEKLQKHLKNQPPLKGAVMGAALGILTPFCSASMVPVAMGMIEMSAPFSTVFPFLITAPLSNFVVVGMIFGTFGFKIAVFYFVWTFGCAIAAGMTIGRSRVRYQVKSIEEILSQKNAQSGGCCADTSATEVDCCGQSFSKQLSCCAQSAPKDAASCCTQSAPEDAASCCTQSTPDNAASCCAQSVPVKETSCCAQNELAKESSCCAAAPADGTHVQKAKGALQFAWILFKRIIPYVMLGAAISGFAVAYLPDDIVARYVGNSSWYAIPLAAAIGVPLYLRIEMALPLLSVLLTKGMSLGAAMALLIGGTGASAPELAILSSMLKPKGLAVFILTMFTIATVGGFLFMLI